MKDHPIFHPAYKHPYIFSALVDTYVEMGTKYWIDFPVEHGRCRLTNVKTGHWVVFGSHSVLASPRDISYPDELIWRNFPGPDIRVKVGDTRYEYITISQPRDLPSIRVATAESTLCLIFLEDATGLTYDYGTLRDVERSAIRASQFAILEAHRAEFNPNHPADLFNKKVLSGPLF